ncbi:MAG TPA: hypothetical protein VL549_09720, partial [Gemmatimonadales bacterium]|nr:hypothetical protein [Gemmatimonadales bacterium]
WDKRDDDLMPFSVLPRSVNLTFTPPPGEPGGIVAGPQSVTVRFLENHLVQTPPRVAEARLDAAAIFFRFEGNDCELDENVWRVHLGGILNGLATPILSIERPGRFQRMGDTTWYQCDLTAGELREFGNQLQQVCPPGSSTLAAGTAIWFDDIIGHVAPPDLVGRGVP